MLLNNVSKVYAIDVGHGQLAQKLASDPRVISMEGTNIRTLESLPEKAHGAVIDLSFISLKLVLDSVKNLLTDDGFIVALIKPQFEAGIDRLPKDGVVKDENIRALILSEVLAFAETSKWKVVETIVSPIEGKTGNVEYLTYLKKSL